VLTQSASATQVALLQTVGDAHTTPPLQALVLAGVTHRPAPSQAGAARSCALAQLVAPQEVAATRKRHAPLPSQVPSCPQVALSSGHLVFDDPPATIGRHRPLAAPVSALPQDRHSPAQALSQHTPPTH
jgi:hypothetical protein